MPAATKPRFFANPAAFGAWLAKNGATRSELVVGFWKVGTGKPSMTWAGSVEQALMHGWIDGVRRSLGDEAYTIRFSPRKPTSGWSNVNVRIAKRLLAEGRMAPAGQRAFEARRRDQAPRAAYEQAKAPRLGPAEARRFKADAAAWRWFQASAPSYQRTCSWWIMSAKRPETRTSRLERLILHAGKGEILPQYRWSKAKKPL